MNQYLDAAIRAARAAGALVRENFGRPLKVNVEEAHDIKLELDVRGSVATLQEWSDNAGPMLLAASVSGLFKWRQFEPEVILLAVGWYLRFSLSYRDVEELLAERGLHADHVTVWRWVQRYAPEMERRLRSRLRPTNDSWRVDETYIGVKGKWVYIYRAVESSGATIDFLLSAKRDAAAAERTRPTSWLVGFNFSRCRSVFLPMSPLAPVTRILLIVFAFLFC